MLEEKFIRGLLQFRKTVLAIIIGMTLVAGYFAQKVSFENSIEIWFLEDDSNLLTYRDFLERFEGDQRSIIGVFSESGIQHNL